MKMLCFRQATISPLQILSVWIAEMQTDDGVENFYKYYIQDDFGSPVDVRPLNIYGYSRIECRQNY